jgi:hypothetical protein
VRERERERERERRREKKREKERESLAAHSLGFSKTRLNRQTKTISL